MAKNGLGLEGRNVLVVGAGSGIGYASAMLAGRVGANVACADLDGGRAAEVSDDVAALGVKSASIAGDVTVEGQAVRVVNDAAHGLGTLDAVINIVGFASWATLFETDDHMWELDLRRNLTQHLYVGRAAARYWIDRGAPGAIAAVASVSGIYGAANHGAYGAAKAGLIDLVRTMNQEWASHNIRTNAIAPDMIATPRAEAAHEAAGTSADDVAVGGGVPLQRAGLPDEIAGPLVFLISDLASFISGQTIVVDGGTMARFPHVHTTTQMPRGTGE